MINDRGGVVRVPIRTSSDMDGIFLSKNILRHPLLNGSLHKS